MTDPVSSTSTILRISRALTWGYLSLGVLGLPGLLALFDPVVLVLSLFCIYVGIMEAGLRRAWVREGHPPAGLRRLRIHQASVLFLGWGALVLLWRIDLAPYLAQLPPWVLQMLVQSTEALGLTPESYLRLMWRATILLLAVLFTAKQLWILRRYR